MKKKKIVFIAYLRGLGGAQKQIVTIANGMANLGYEVSIISFGDNKHIYKINENIKQFYINDIKHFNFFHRFLCLKKYLDLLKPDVSINFWFQPVYFEYFMRKKITGKIIYSERCDPSDKQYNGVMGMLRKVVFKKVDNFVFQTTAAKEYFNEKIQKRSIIIQNPVFLERTSFTKILNKRKVIVSVGRLHKQKNFSNLIKAFEIISKKYSDFKLEIYGDGPEESHLKELIHSLNLDDKVLLMGSKENIYNYIYDASLFVLSSDYEGMPNVLLEAMVLGVPCVSTNWAPGGIKDIIIDGVNGLVVPCNDSKELSLAMDKMLSNEKLSKKCSKNAKNSYELYKPNTIFSKWKEIIEK